MRRSLQHAGVFDKIPQDNFFFQLEDAVAVAKKHKVASLSPKNLEDYSDDEAAEGSFMTKISDHKSPHDPQTQSRRKGGDNHWRAGEVNGAE
ncbi:hypothetical protein C0Q70_05138 [Pomacea canaliculata]|uniref:Uncharacterized protein n=1 Tax=Pomacea canaliculata TaxID=400727 RepID=A0A2T7PKB1_POMCA|nr:hypothetical protein C0Q70_05138 [Pomacea canaliculata]